MARSTSDRAEGRLALLGLIAVMGVVLVIGREAAVERRTSPVLTADIQAPVAAFLAAPLRAVEGSLASAEDRAHALEENKALRAELSALRHENQRLGAMRLRLERLESILDVRLDGQIPSDRIAARVVSDPSGPFVRSYLLDAGRRSGVRDGYAVMSDAGLVGHVVSAGERSARVIRLDDLNSRVAVLNPRTGARAIMVGANDGTAELRFTSGENPFGDSDRVVTSGDDGRLPPGLPIGQVSDADAVLRVALDFTTKPVDYVMVLPFEPVAEVEAPDEETPIEPIDEDAG